jgi:ribosome-interacting GTPase 1
MFLTDEIIKATKKYCGGVAVSCHKHLTVVWEEALNKLTNAGIKTNLHVIISDKQSVDEFIEIYKKYNKIVDYFVLLPYTAAGRASFKKVDYKYLMKKVKKEDISKIAFGANFYPYLVENKYDLDVSLYEPEILSKYLDLSDMSLYKSSFNLTKVN